MVSSKQKRNSTEADSAGASVERKVHCKKRKLSKQLLIKGKSRKYQGVFKVKSRVKTRQVWEIWSQPLEHKQVPNKETEQGVQKGKWDRTEMLTVSFLLRAKTEWIPLRMNIERCWREEGHNLYPLESRLSAGRLFRQKQRKCCRLETQTSWWYHLQSICF